MLQIDYRHSDFSAELAWSFEDVDAPWLRRIIELIESNSGSYHRESGLKIELPWWEFLQLRSEIVAIWSAYGVRKNVDVTVSEIASNMLVQQTREQSAYNRIVSAEPLPADEVITRLDAVGFKRPLTQSQLRNVSILSRHNAGATFSVPGAGKTTEALGFFSILATLDHRLLVVAPKNAFSSWEEQFAQCFDSQDNFVRLRGGRDAVSELLAKDPRFSLITYQQLINVSDIVAAHIQRNQFFVFLDESHKIKSGIASATGQATLRLAPLAKGRLLLSGTPMPQSTADLVPQFQFLFPSKKTNPLSVADDIQPVYVRTTKDELGLPPIKRRNILVEMTPNQRHLYDLLRSEVRRQASGLDEASVRDLRRIGKSILRMLHYCSEPLLLAENLDGDQADLLSALYSEGDSPKIEYILRRTRELNLSGEKVLIWSSFRRNVEYLAERLSDKGAVYIHGGVDAGSDEMDDSREGKVKRFKSDDTCQVLVANPAAAGEGISLHDVCHHAIYLDRTFNAAHYLQSEDRIHRLGLDPGQETKIEILQYQPSIDQAVDRRLTQKIQTMGEVLSDPSLMVERVPIDTLPGQDFEEFEVGIDVADIDEILRDIIAP